MKKRKRQLFEVKFTKKYGDYSKGDTASFQGPHASNLVRVQEVAEFVLSDKELRAQTKTAASADRIKKRRAAEKRKVTVEAKRNLVIALAEADEQRNKEEQAKALVLELEQKRDEAVKDAPQDVQKLKDQIIVAANKHSKIAGVYYDAKLAVAKLEETLGIKEDETYAAKIAAESEKETDTPPATDKGEEDLNKVPETTK